MNPSSPLSRKTGNSGSFWGEKFSEGGKEKKHTKTAGKPPDFLLLHNGSLQRGFVDGVELKLPQKQSREMQSLVNLSLTLNSGLV